MAWTTPKTWTAEVMSSSDLNTHLRDNLNALKDPPSDNYEADEVSNYTTTSTTFVDVDATNLALTINTNGGDVMVGFIGTVVCSSFFANLDVDVDGARDGGDDGYCTTDSSAPTVVSFTRLITGLAAGSHTFKLQWKCTDGSATATLYAGAGTSRHDTHPQFWVREVS